MPILIVGEKESNISLDLVPKRRIEMLAWTDPPLKDRIGTVDGDFAIAYLSESESGAERAGVVRRHTLLEAREAALSLIKSGHQVRIFNKEGTIVY